MTDYCTEAQALISRLLHNPVPRRDASDEFQLRFEASELIRKQEQELTTLRADMSIYKSALEKIANGVAGDATLSSDNCYEIADLALEHVRPT